MDQDSLRRFLIFLATTQIKALSLKMLHLLYFISSTVRNVCFLCVCVLGGGAGAAYVSR